MTNIFWPAFIKGYTTAAGLIVAIGAQNAFILKQGLLRSHVLAVAVIASIIDILMIVLGVQGLGIVIASHPYLMFVAKYGGILFLFLYGCRCFYLALFKPGVMAGDHVKGERSLKLTILTLLAVSFLNPHMYLDTVLLIGTIGAQLQLEARIHYILGAALASTVWFFLLAYGARFLIPVFKKPVAWKILDVLIGIMMWALAFSVWQN